MTQTGHSLSRSFAFTWLFLVMISIWVVAAHWLYLDFYVPSIQRAH